MSNLPTDQKLAFDTELSQAGSALSGTPLLLGTLTNEPVILLVKNQTSVSVFFADNPGSTKGTTMASGEEFVLDCRSNNGTARNMGFPIGTPFYATQVSGTPGAATGAFKVSVLYAF
jgi:hypothetical protein